jgi:hypothetical protein
MAAQLLGHSIDVWLGF